MIWYRAIPDIGFINRIVPIPVRQFVQQHQRPVQPISDPRGEQIVDESEEIDSENESNQNCINQDGANICTDQEFTDKEKGDFTE